MSSFSQMESTDLFNRFFELTVIFQIEFYFIGSECACVRVGTCHWYIERTLTIVMQLSGPQLYQCCWCYCSFYCCRCGKIFRFKYAMHWYFVWNLDSSQFDAWNIFGILQNCTIFQSKFGFELQQCQKWALKKSSSVSPKSKFKKFKWSKFDFSAAHFGLRAAP